MVKSATTMLRQKILAVGVIPPALLTAFILAMLAVQGWRLGGLVQTRTGDLVREQLARTARDARLLCEASHEEISRRVRHNLGVAQDVVASGGPISLGRERVAWRAVNQLDGAAHEVVLPKLLVGGKWLGRNTDLSRTTPLVDEIRRLVGGAATVFQKMDAQGDMLRVATNVTTKEGVRAVGTYIPAVNPDGAANEVVAEVLRGRVYEGRAFVVDAWYLTAYAPLRDGSGAIVGMLFVGVRQDSLEGIRRAILGMRVGRSGEVMVLGGKGAQRRGTYVVSAGGQRDGENAWEARDASGKLFVQDLVSKALALDPDATGFADYTVASAGASEPRRRVAAVSYFEPWDWVITASMEHDEYAATGRSVVRSIGASAAAMLLLAVALLSAAAWAARGAAARIAGPVEVLAEMKQDLEREVQERRQVEEALRESEAKFRKLTEQAPVGVYLIQDGIFAYVNPRMAEVFGYAVEDLVDRKGPLDLVHPDDRPLAESHIARRFAGAASLSYGFRGVTRSGEVRFIEVFGAATLFRSRPALVGTLVDVTERKKMESELARVEKLESLGVLAGGIAHDFNNILVSILTNVSLVRKEASPGGPVSEMLGEAEQAALRARDLTYQLLTFSRGGAPIKKQIALGNLVRESTAFALRGSRVACQYALAPDLWPIEADPGQMSQVIHNLVLNAVQAMPDGGTIEVQACNVERAQRNGKSPDPSRRVRLAIRDHGVGIAPEVRQKIFDPFFTTKRTGTGLGLASAYSIVKRHGGELEVESEVGNGSTFAVYLPATNGVAVAAAEPVRERPGKARILVLDDEEMVRRSAARMLRSLGYEVETACDGAEAAELFRKGQDSGTPFDAVIMDLTVPGGWSSERTLQKLREYDPGVRAIVSSGYSNDPIMSHYREHGFVGVAAKPYGIAELSETLHRALGSG